MPANPAKCAHQDRDLCPCTHRYANLARIRQVLSVDVVMDVNGAVCVPTEDDACFEAIQRSESLYHRIVISTAAISRGAILRCCAAATEVGGVEIFQTLAEVDAGARCDPDLPMVFSSNSRPEP